MENDIKEVIKEHLDKIEIKDKEKSKELEKQIKDIILDENLKVMKKEEIIKKLDKLKESNNEINYSKDLSLEELENILEKYNN